MNRHFNNRAVSQVIAALLLIAIAVAAAVLLYVFSIGLLGSLGSSGGQQTKQQLVMEAYNWNTLTTIKLNMRNVGSAAVNLATADIFVAGIKAATPTWTCVVGPASAVPPQDSCTTDLTPPTLSPVVSGGVAYVLKVVTPDGAVFSYTIIAGQAS